MENNTLFYKDRWCLLPFGHSLSRFCQKKAEETMLERASRPRERALQPPFCICKDSSEARVLTVREKQACGWFCKFQWPSASSYSEGLKKKPRPKFGRNLSPLPSFQLLGYLWFKQCYFCQGTASLCFFEAWALLCLEVFIWFLLPSSLIHNFFLLFSNKPSTLYNIFASRYYLSLAHRMFFAI